MTADRMIAKKGELTINAIFGIFIAIITIFLLLSFFSLQMPTFAKQAYCKTFFYVASAPFLPEGIRQEQEYCREFSMMSSVEIKPQNVFVRALSEGSRTKKLIFIGAQENEVKVSVPENSTLTSFSFLLKGNLSSASVDVCADGTSEWNISQMAPSREYSSPKEIFQSAKNCAEKCAAFPCNITIKISGENGEAMLSEIEVSYKKCLLKEEIAAAILACWEKANYGAYSRNLQCTGLAVRRCQNSGINESSITNYLKEQKLCNVISNSDFGCGERDEIEWQAVSIKSEGSVLIEFVNSSRKIRVS
jgi:hypothetical protein